MGKMCLRLILSGDVALGDRRVWRREWPMGLQLSMIRSRAIRILDIQSVRNKKYTQIQKIVSGSGGKLRSQMRESDFVDFFRDLFSSRDMSMQRASVPDMPSTAPSPPNADGSVTSDGSAISDGSVSSDRVGAHACSARGCTTANWLEVLKEEMWVPEAKALFRMFDDVNAGAVLENCLKT